MQVDLSGKRVLITGGTGFIGGRLVERLVLECGADVRVLVRNFAHAARVARFPVEMVKGDVVDAAAVRRAVDGCDIVFHCAYGNVGGPDKQREATVGGTENLVEAALASGASRVVHVSTINVYGATPAGDVDETAARQYFGDSYSDTKLDAEKAALELFRTKGAPVTVVQPTVVYGPYGPAWTVRILGELSTGRIILVDGGDGLCNAVYVDDVVSGMILAGVRDEAVGEVFLLSGEAPVTWKEFYAGYERMLGFESHVVLSSAEAGELFKKHKKKKSVFAEGLSMLREQGPVRHRVSLTAEVAAVKGMARALVPQALRRSLKSKLTAGNGAAPATAPADEPDKPIQLLSPASIQVQAAQTRFRIDKAKRLLGYRPAFDFAAGMERTAEWARWANLLPASASR